MDKTFVCNLARTTSLGAKRRAPPRLGPPPHLLSARARSTFGENASFPTSHARSEAPKDTRTSVTSVLTGEAQGCIESTASGGGRSGTSACTVCEVVLPGVRRRLDCRIRWRHRRLGIPRTEVRAAREAALALYRAHWLAYSSSRRIYQAVGFRLMTKHPIIPP